MKHCTVQGCRTPISVSQEFCARCWNNVPDRYQREYVAAAAVLQRAKIGERNALRMIRIEAGKALELT